jgi:hypothetical protein
MNFILRRFLRSLIQSVVTPPTIMKIIDQAFTLLRNGTAAIPGTLDDELLDRFESSIDKAELARRICRFLLDLLAPVLAVSANCEGDGDIATETAIVKEVVDAIESAS